MRQEVADFSKQLAEAMAIAEGAVMHELDREFKNVVITGMGGSGIGGTIVAELVSKDAKIPISVNKDYTLPAYVGEHTLVIVSSYSGNTEETLSAMTGAEERGAKIVCIASDGKIIERAQEKSYDFIKVPSGGMPRACLGYSLVSLLYILKNFNILGIDFSLKEELENSIALIDQEEESIQSEAQNIAEFLHGKTPVLYATSGLSGATTRLRQQLNENAKVLCWDRQLPEMHHNELLAWQEKRDDLAVLIIKKPKENPQMEKRLTFTEKTLLNYTGNLAQITTKGKTIFENAIYLIHLGDWVSVMLAEMKDVNPDEMEIIENLKKELAK